MKTKETAAFEIESKVVVYRTRDRYNIVGVELPSGHSLEDMKTMVIGMVADELIELFKRIDKENRDWQLFKARQHKGKRSAEIYQEEVHSGGHSDGDNNHMTPHESRRKSTKKEVSD